MLPRAARWVGPFVLGALAVGCGGGGGGGGGFAATAAAATSGSTTTPGGTATNPAVAAVTSLRLPGTMVLAGDVPVAFRITDPRGAPASAKVELSTDGGATWRAATPAASSAGLSNLATAPAPGTEHIFTWASAADIPGLASAIVRVSLTSGGAGLTASAVVDNAPLSTSVRLNRRPYLQLTKQTSTLVLWRTETDTDSVIEWGDTPALGRVAGDPSARRKDHEVELTGLTAGGTYYYRVSSGGQPVTARERFEAAPPSNAAGFTFLAFGDSGTMSREQMAVAARMATEDADVIIHTGDVIYPYGALGNPVGEYNDRFFKPYEAFLGRTPMFPVIGNHDLIALLGQPFKQAFQLPDNGSSIARELYFSFEWGDAKFIALETTGLFLIPLGDHMRWLQNEIQNNTKKWLFVYMHVPLYSCGSHGNNVILQQVLEPLFENGKVDLVLTGHDHNYERTKPIKQFNQDPAYPGLVHVLTGGGGAGTRGISPNSRTAVAQSIHHYMRFRVQGDTLTGEAIDLNGATIDTFTIQNIR